MAIDPDQKSIRYSTSGLVSRRVDLAGGKNKMGKFIFGLIVGLIIIPLFVYLYFSTGRAPVATNSAPMPFEKWFAGMALHAGMGKAAQQQSPLPADETNLTAGAQVYRDH